jgi:hypothetical protein
MRRFIRVLINFAAVSVLLVSMPVRADYKSEYKDGVKAFEKKNYALAESKLRAAIETSPVSEEKVRIYGMRFEPYLPHHYLGLTLAARGQCQQALNSFANASNQSVLSALRTGGEFSAAEAAVRKRCQVQLASTSNSGDSKNPNQTNPPPVAQTTPVQTQTPPPVTSPLASPRITGTQTYTQTTTQTSTPPVTGLSTQRISEARAQVNRFRSSLRSFQSSANALAVPNPQFVQKIAQFEAKAQQLSAAVEASIRSNNEANLAKSLIPIAQSERELGSLAGELKQLQALRNPAPAALAAIAKAYFAGSFAECARMDVNSLSGKAKAHALILRAAAKYTLYTEKEITAQLDSVRKDLADARIADAAVTPKASYFSPAFVQLFNQR